MVSSAASPDDSIRAQILRYLFDRNRSATSARGKKGAAVKIGDMRRELKERHGLRREEVVGNVEYLISQGFVERQFQQRVVPTNNGRQFPSSTPYYAITARGIDKIEGPSEFSPRDRFAGILNINATGQSTVSVGDGNQVNVKYADQGEALASLCTAIKNDGQLTAGQKMDAVAQIDTIQAQLSRAEPDVGVIRATWATIEPLSKIASLANLVVSVADKLARFLI